jgi:hypothetical protein
MDLTARDEEILAAAERQGLLVFPGYVADDLLCVWWQGDPEAWPDLLGIAKAEGVRTLFVGRAVLTADDLQDLADWEEHARRAGPTNGNRSRIKGLERYIGFTGEIRLGYIKDGIAYLLMFRTEWYEDFVDLVEESEADEEYS